MSIERYDVRRGRIRPSKKGKWVKFEEYASLYFELDDERDLREDDRARHLDEIEALRRGISQINAVMETTFYNKSFEDAAIWFEQKASETASSEKESYLRVAEQLRNMKKANDI
jgi:hypothetical protein